MVWIIESTTRWRGWGTVEPQWLCLITPTCVGRPINFSHMSKPCVCISVCPHYLLQHSSKVFISVCQHYQLWCSLQVSGHLGMDISSHYCLVHILFGVVWMSGCECMYPNSWKCCLNESACKCTYKQSHTDTYNIFSSMCSLSGPINTGNQSGVRLENIGWGVLIQSVFGWKFRTKRVVGDIGSWTNGMSKVCKLCWCVVCVES